MGVALRKVEKINCSVICGLRWMGCGEGCGAVGVLVLVVVIEVLVVVAIEVITTFVVRGGTSFVCVGGGCGR